MMSNSNVFLFQTGLYILTLVAFSSTELWSTVSWFIQIFYPIIIFISFFWNWLYLYLNAFAEYQYNMVKMDSYKAKCIGIEKMDWIDHLMDWLRRTLTFRADPCELYHRMRDTNPSPFMLVRPDKVFMVTFITIFTAPMEELGIGICEFVKVLLADSPFTVQITLFLLLALTVVAAFQHGIAGLFRSPPR
ncbi:chloride channel CLIC-like protein 1 [Genypterus blacodes]|uniref:chloride channel CLIC-like protein 1 n=1 Tax=Genypterus blacodes TaxID=154954 RepID=UPI003F76E3A1